jgi:hypothetical protein
MIGIDVVERVLVHRLAVVDHLAERGRIETHLGGHLGLVGGAAEPLLEPRAHRRKLAPPAHGRAADRRVAAQMVDNRTADAQGGIGRKGVAAILEAVGGLDQGDHADLGKVLDVDRRSDPAVDVPGDLADELHVRAHQHVRRRCRLPAIGRRAILWINERHR